MITTMDTTIQTGIRISKSLYDRLKRNAKREKRSLNNYITGILEAANHCQIPDYEDAAQIACALNHFCDAIITNDQAYSRYTSLPVYSPAAFCDALFGRTM